MSASATACEAPGCHRRAETFTKDADGYERHVCPECVDAFGGDG